ncbi:hypothetical protein EPN15_00980 [Patescibacteria group bacterium]|nr:MAG: hypothetical protein EPN15_00980 [Patescibacteria group bacterium]
MNNAPLNTTNRQTKIKNALTKTFGDKLAFAILMSIEDAIHYFRHRKELILWDKNEKPVQPPHLIKRDIVREYAKKFNLNIFIETGTYLGEMIGAMRRIFKEIYSIELDPVLCDRAKKKFAKSRHINIYCGDSGIVLPQILSKQTTPCLFWLDAHYSAGITAKGELETPIIKELNQILDHPVKEHVILIDDARCFTGENDYPTIEGVTQLVSSKRSDLVTHVENDIIRIHKKSIK